MRWKVDILATDLKQVETTHDFVGDYAAEVYIGQQLSNFCPANRIRV